MSQATKARDTLHNIFQALVQFNEEATYEWIDLDSLENDFLFVDEQLARLEGLEK